MKTTKPLGTLGIIGMVVLLFVLGLIGGFGSGLLSDLPGIGGLMATGVFLLLVMAGILWVSFWWWRRLDEAAREAHKWAWFWGGSTGMLVGLMLMLTLQIGHVDVDQIISTDGSRSGLIVGGMMSILLFQIAGYALAWGWWWLARMRG